MTAAHHTSRMLHHCQGCGADTLESVLFIGMVTPVNTMPTIGGPGGEEPAYPLELLRCPSCGLAQINCEVDASVLFPYSYPYLTGSTRILRENFADLCVQMTPRVPLNPNDLVIDVGSNDGTLLSNFQNAGFRVLGIEPSQAGALANERGIPTRIDYFTAETAAAVLAEHGPAKLVTATNVFAHIANVHDVIAAIVSLLAPDGVFTNESHYLGGLLATVQYDTIYHEHLRYYHLGALIPLLARHGLDVFHVEKIPSHGGSIRVSAARKGQKPIDASVGAMLAEETAQGLMDGSGFKTFRDRVAKSKRDLYTLIAPLRAAGARIVGIGAPSRASTLINYCGLDDQIIEAVLEISTSNKLNKYMPGTRIPVLDEKLLFETQPEYAFLMSWHIADELIANLRRKGYRGKFIVPLPEPHIVT